MLWKRSASEWVQFFPQTLCDLELFTFIVTLPAASRSRQGESLGNNGITVSPMSRIKRTDIFLVNFHRRIEILSIHETMKRAPILVSETRFQWSFNTLCTVLLHVTGPLYINIYVYICDLEIAILYRFTSNLVYKFLSANAWTTSLPKRFQ